MKGLELAQYYYFECVQPLIAVHLPQLNNAYAAGLIGFGSDVIGNDDEFSQDHEWGPRLILFLREVEYSHFAEQLDSVLNKVLPRKFRGYSTRFQPDPKQGHTLVMTKSPEGRHNIVVTTPERFMQLTLGVSTRPQQAIEWLTIPEQRLLEFTSGAIFADPIGEISYHRQQFAYFPTAVWQYKLAYIFESLGWELGLISLCGRRGDSLSMHLNTAVTIERLIKLAFLLHRRYCPGYKKWLQREFDKLPDTALVVGPLLHQALHATYHDDIVTYLNEALAYLYQQLLALDELEANLPNELPEKDDRGEAIIDTQCIATYLLDSISDPLQTLRIHNSPYGAIDQWVTNEDILLSAAHTQSLLSVYRAGEVA